MQRPPQVVLLLLVDFVALAFHLYGRPFISRWVNVVETTSLLGEAVVLLALLSGQLDWGWDAGRTIMISVAVLTIVLLVDQCIAQLQLAATLLSMRTAVGLAVRGALGRAADRLTGRAAARVGDCAETEVALELSERGGGSWRCRVSVAAAPREGPPPPPAEAVLDLPCSAPYDAALAGLARALDTAPAAPDGSTLLRVRAALREEGRRLAADLGRAAAAVGELREQGRAEAAREAFGRLRHARFAARGRRWRVVRLGAEKEEEEDDAEGNSKDGAAGGGGEEEGALPAAGRLGDDDELDALLGAHGLLPREAHAAERRARRAALGRLEGQATAEARAKARALRERWEEADALRRRRLRAWRSVARALWRFAGVLQLLEPAAGGDLEQPSKPSKSDGGGSPEPLSVDVFGPRRAHANVFSNSSSSLLQRIGTGAKEEEGRAASGGGRGGAAATHPVQEHVREHGMAEPPIHERHVCL